MDRRVQAGAAAVMVAALAAGCGQDPIGGGPAVGRPVASAARAGAPLIPPPGIDVTGVLRIELPYFEPAGPGQCKGSGYAMGGVRAGSTVVVTVEGGAQVGLGRLGAGYPEVPQMELAVWCELPFTVPDVPPGHRFYTFEIDGGRNTAVQFREDEIRAPIRITYS